MAHSHLVRRAADIGSRVTAAVGGSIDQGRQDNLPSPSVLRTSTPTSTSPLTSTSGDNLIAVPFLAFNGNVRERGDRSLGELYTTYFYKGLSLLGVWDFGNNDFSLTGPTAPSGWSATPSRSTRLSAA